MGATDLDRARVLTVADAMSPRPITIDPEAPLATVLAVMVERSVRHLPVVDDAGRLVGIVTDRDLHGAFVAPAVAERLSARGRRRLRALEEIPETLRVRDVMTWGCITTTADAPLAQAAARMTEGRFGALVVVEHGRLVGILTRHDVLRALARLLPSIKGDADDYFW